MIGDDKIAVVGSIQHKSIGQLVHIKKSIFISLIGLGMILIVGFGLRTIYLQKMILHVDEFVSLLGIKMTLEKGVPIYPSGVFEGKGIVYSYLGAGASTVVPFSLETIRYLTLAISVITILTVYWIAFQLFANRWAAFLGALLIAIHPAAILWGGRARMYSLATLLLFLILLVSWLGLHYSKTKPYLLTLIPLTILVALLTHLVIIINLPALIVALTITYWLRNKPRINHLNDWFWLLTVVVAIIVVTGFGAWMSEQPAEVRQWRETSSVFANISRAIFDLRLLRNFYNFFLIPENIGATVLAFIGLAGLAIKARRNVLNKPDYAALFIHIQLFLTFVGLYVFVPSGIREERHNFIVLLPHLILVAAYGGMTVAEYLQQRYVTSQWLSSGYLSIIVVGLVFQQAFQVNQLLFTDNSDTYRYDKALTLVNQQIRPEDQLLTVLPSAAYLYNGPLDYYANQYKPLYFEDPRTNQRLDYYTGSIYLHQVEELFQVLEQPGRLWFVIDAKRLTRNYNSRFSQEVLHQMALFDRVDNVLIFVEKADHWPMATSPAKQISVDFSNQVHLEGYSTQLVDSDLRLTLFWKPIAPIYNYKVFVHLRDDAGNTVAQADFAPYDDVISMPHWRLNWGDNLIPTGTVLELSPEMFTSSPDDYQLFIGLYVPALNFERVPLVDDSSGENAVILTDIGL